MPLGTWLTVSPFWLIGFFFCGLIKKSAWRKDHCVMSTIIQGHIFRLFATWLGQWGCRLPNFRLSAWLADRHWWPLAWVACLLTVWQNSHSPGLTEWMNKGSVGGWRKIRRKCSALSSPQRAARSPGTLLITWKTSCCVYWLIAMTDIWQLEWTFLLH